VNQAPLVGGRQPLGNLLADPQDFVHTHGRSFGDPTDAAQQAFECFAFQELHRQEGNSSVLGHLVDRDNMIVAHLGRCLGLAQETLPRGRLTGQGRLHHLERDRAVQLRVFRLEDDPHAAGAEEFLDPVRTEPADLAVPLCRRQDEFRFHEDLQRRSFALGRDALGCRFARVD
jgi:hypothetical protein